jgi:phosphotriesterase-related protein
VLSHDVSCATDWWSEEDVSAALPEWHYGYIQQSLIPALLERGVGGDLIDLMMRRNPHDFFAARAGARNGA